MKTHARHLIGAVAILALLVVALPNSLQGTNPEHGTSLDTAIGNSLTAQHDLAVQSMSAMPLAFTENKGQWDEQVLFRANSGGATMWFCKDRIVYQFTRRIPSPSRESGKPDELAVMPGASPLGRSAFDLRDPRGHEKDSVEQLVVTAKFAGANPNVDVVGEGLQEYKCNYFLGNDPAKWRTDVPNYLALVFKNIYPGIDLRCSGEGTGMAGYEFVAEPGADIGQIKVKYEGVEELSVDESGRMGARTAWGDMTAVVSRPVGGAGPDLPRLPAGACLAPLTGNASGFRVAGQSTPQSASVAVTLDYSTFLGVWEGDEGRGIAVDGSGCAYVTGSTYSSGFPKQNAYDASHNGWWDVFVTKLSPAGNALVYSTFLGGSGYDWGLGIALDGSGCAYVTGSTYSSDFPTQNAYDASYNGVYDVFVTKLSAVGNALVYSTFLGGSNIEEGHGINVDGSGCAYVTGTTESSAFPTQNAYDASCKHGDVFVTELTSSGNALVYSTFLGGWSWDEGWAIAVDGTGCAYVTGSTSSPDFPTQNAYDGSHNGSGDVFVTKLSSVGNSLVYSTFLGGSSAEWGYGIAIDSSRCAYVTGNTFSSNFPTQNAYDANYNGSGDVFVARLSSSGNALVYSTFLGGSDDDYGSGIAVDGSGCAYVTGWNWSSNFQDDVFVTKLSSSGNALVYRTFLGGSGDDYGSGIAVDGSGCAYVTGKTGSSRFPTQNAYDASYDGGGDVFVTKLRGPCDCTGWCDLNNDAMLSASDVVLIVNYAFAQQDARQQIAGCPHAQAPNRNGDWNCDGFINLVDVVYCVNFVYRSWTHHPPCNPCACDPYPSNCPPWP